MILGASDSFRIETIKLNCILAQHHLRKSNRVLACNLASFIIPVNARASARRAVVFESHATSPQSTAARRKTRPSEHTLSDIDSSQFLKISLSSRG